MSGPRRRLLLRSPLPDRQLKREPPQAGVLVLVFVACCIYSRTARLRMYRKTSPMKIIVAPTAIAIADSA